MAGMIRDAGERPRFRIAGVQAAVSLVAVGAVTWWALRQDAPPLPTTGEGIGAVALAILVYAGATCARAERWHRIVAASGCAVDRAETYPLTTVGYMGNNILPARGGDLLRVFLLAPRARASRRSALGTVVAERLLDVVALALLFTAVAYGLVADAEVPHTRAAVLLVLAALATVAIAAFAVSARLGVLVRVRDFVRPVLAASRDLVGVRGLGLLLVSIAIWTLEATVYLVAARAVSIELDLLGALYVVALTNLFALLPAAPGYVGTFDAAVLFAVGSLGHDGSDALAYLLLLRFVLFVPITVTGLSFFLTRYRGTPLLRRPRSPSLRLD